MGTISGKEQQYETPVFLDDDYICDVPPCVTVTNAYSEYGWRPGQSLEEAIMERKKKEKESG